MKTTTSVALIALLSSSITSITAQDAPSQDHNDPTSVWYWTGADSVYWHTRYHGCLAMAAENRAYRTHCPQFFTHETLQRQYPGNTNEPFVVVGEWGPTPKYGSEGFMVRVPEMNKILMVFKGIYGWENFNATLAPLLGVGCDERCMAHAGAIEAWAEVKEATNDMQAIKENQGDLVWSASGHGFGGMIMQVAALELKHRGLLFSAQSFGSPPVFNENAARRWDDLFIGDASQRTVANRDSVPTKIPYRNKYMPDGTLSNSSYVFVNTGIHVWTNSTIQEAPMGRENMYGQNYVYCLGNNEDPRCAGGDSEMDHYFYFTDMGTCCENGWNTQYNASFNRAALEAEQAAYSATATAPRLDMPNTSLIPASTTTSSSIEPTSTALNETSTAAEATNTASGAINPQNNAAAASESAAAAGQSGTGAADVKMTISLAGGALVALAVACIGML